MSHHGYIPYDGLRPPRGPFVLNDDSPQVANLRLWYPMMRHNGKGHRETIRDYGRNRHHAARSGTGIGEGVVPEFGITVPDFDGTVGDDGCYTTGTINDGLIDIAAGSSIYWVTCWARPIAVPSSTFDSLLFEHINSGLTDGWGVSTSNGATNGVQIFTVGANSGFRDTFPDGELHHWGFLFDQANTRVAIWKDSVRVHNDASYTNTSASTNAKFTIGGRTESAGNFPFDGLIFDMRLYEGDGADTLIPIIYNPQTRWDLYYELGQRKYYVVAPAVAAIPSLVMAPYIPAQ